LTQGNAKTKALLEAISDAEAAGLDDDELRKYRTAVHLEERLAFSRLQLMQAARHAGAPGSDCREVASELAAALAAGEAAGLSEEELQEARSLFEKEEIKARARQRLEDALNTRQAVEPLADLQPKAAKAFLAGRERLALGGKPQHGTPRSRMVAAHVADLKRSARINYL
jgi:hypothetical protein